MCKNKGSLKLDVLTLITQASINVESGEIIKELTR